jgi:hypothetical protein
MNTISAVMVPLLNILVLLFLVSALYSVMAVKRPKPLILSTVPKARRRDGVLFLLRLFLRLSVVLFCDCVCERERKRVR